MDSETLARPLIDLALTINGEPVRTEIDPATLLVELLREERRLTGTHVGCDTSQCGACTVHVNGRPVKSCTVLAAQVAGEAITTIEGIGTPEALHPLQAAFSRHHALQCGYCTPGMIMAGLGIIARHGAALDAATVREELDGNLCRCTGYEGIVAAILEVARDGEGGGGG
ncbi:(2Fe-2S)-binding protein [Acuticoccus kandeliae]|uniref:(2Fe-2S)-binding protein n=1 Tax=Acuticoccus kandeliae TaxID=2073160 RepID=UPI001FEA4A42|nr:(2Fe-2S)-binding protein [Acuticoccus kandeliae]